MTQKNNTRRSHRRKGRAKRQVKSRRSRKQRGGKRYTGNASFKTALRRLYSLRPVQRVEAMKMANTKFIRQFCHSVKKLRHARLSPALRKRLGRQSKRLKKLVSNTTSNNTKRKMLTQRGGGILALLLPTLISAVASAGASAISSSLGK